MIDCVDCYTLLLIIWLQWLFWWLWCVTVLMVFICYMVFGDGDVVIRAYRCWHFTCAFTTTPHTHTHFHVAFPTFILPLLPRPPHVITLFCWYSVRWLVLLPRFVVIYVVDCSLLIAVVLFVIVGGVDRWALTVEAVVPLFHCHHLIIVVMHSPTFQLITPTHSPTDPHSSTTHNLVLPLSTFHLVEDIDWQCGGVDLTLVLHWLYR